MMMTSMSPSPSLSYSDSSSSYCICLCCCRNTNNSKFNDHHPSPSSSSPSSLCLSWPWTTSSPHRKNKSKSATKHNYSHPNSSHTFPQIESMDMEMEMETDFEFSSRPSTSALREQFLLSLHPSSVSFKKVSSSANSSPSSSSPSFGSSSPQSFYYISLFSHIASWTHPTYFVPLDEQLDNKIPLRYSHIPHNIIDLLKNTYHINIVIAQSSSQSSSSSSISSSSSSSSSSSPSLPYSLPSSIRYSPPILYHAIYILPLLFHCLSLYSPLFFSSIHLTTIVLVSHLSYDGSPRILLPYFRMDGNVLLVDCQVGDSEFISSSFHHEIFHFVDIERERQRRRKVGEMKKMNNIEMKKEGEVKVGEYREETPEANANDTLSIEMANGKDNKKDKDGEISLSLDSLSSPLNIHDIVDSQWCELNISSFEYKGSGNDKKFRQNHMAIEGKGKGKASFSSSPSTPLGFLNLYSTSALCEDKAEIYSGMIRNPQVMRQHEDQIIRKKSLLIQKEINELMRRNDNIRNANGIDGISEREVGSDYWWTEIVQYDSHWGEMMERERKQRKKKKNNANHKNILNHHHGQLHSSPSSSFPLHHINISMVNHFDPLSPSNCDDHYRKGEAEVGEEEMDQGEEEDNISHWTEKLDSEGRQHWWNERKLQISWMHPMWKRKKKKYQQHKENDNNNSNSDGAAGIAKDRKSNIHSKRVYPIASSSSSSSLSSLSSSFREHSGGASGETKEKEKKAKIFHGRESHRQDRIDQDLQDIVIDDEDIEM